MKRSRSNNRDYHLDSDPLRISNSSRSKNYFHPLYIEIDNDTYNDGGYDTLPNEYSLDNTASLTPISDPLNVFSQQILDNQEESSFAKHRYDGSCWGGNNREWTLNYVSAANRRMDSIINIQKTHTEQSKLFNERMSSLQDSMDAQMSVLKELKEQHETLQNKMQEVSDEIVQMESRLDFRVDELASNFNSNVITLNEVSFMQQQQQKQYQKNRQENTARFYQLEQDVAFLMQTSSVAAAGVGIGNFVQPNGRRNRRRGDASMPVLTPQTPQGFRQPRRRCRYCMKELSKGGFCRHMKKHCRHRPNLHSAN